MEFKYQNYWCRVFFILPLILILPFIENGILLMININLKLPYFLGFSTIITYFIAFALYKRTNGIFTKVGRIEVDEDIIMISKGRKERKFSINSIKKVEWESSKVYGTNFGILLISYEINNKLKKYVVFSENFSAKRTKECSLWNVYKKLKSCKSDI